MSLPKARAGLACLERVAASLLLLWGGYAMATDNSPGLAALSSSVATPLAQNARPRVGLVLSGGGARGLAHVGVLKVLEQLRVPVDVIAGTSMGAIVGGLYASGMSAETLERELLAVRWNEVFNSRVERQLLSQRRKEEDFEISPLVEIGVREGELRAPSGAVSSRGLETLLRRFTLPVREVRRFDELPVPFRAVATDMETGRAVVLNGGDLALALRSSMSVPGLFSPTELDGRILGDGGLVDNLPVDVARNMGADVVIVVNIGTPLAGRDSLNSAVGLTSQMISILTEQNVQRSLASLRSSDVLIAPQLEALGSGDFNRARELMALGEAGARSQLQQLKVLAMDASVYLRWQAARASAAPPTPRLSFVRIQGTAQTNAQRLTAILETQAGQVFEPERAERDARRLAAAGDYTRSDYQLVRGPDGEGLVFDLEDKPWGPNYLHAGLDLSTDLRGNSAFNLKLSHNRHWLTDRGTEWRNRLHIGEVPLAYSEIYHPLNWTSSPANDWFVSGYLGAEQRRQRRFAPDSGDESALLRRSQARVGLDLGQPWGQVGEIRLGWQRQVLRITPLLVGVNDVGPSSGGRLAEDALRARVVVDQLDFANFATRGYRFEGEVAAGLRSGDGRGSFSRIELQGTGATSLGRHTFSLHGLVQSADQRGTNLVGRYSLGGFHQLSGYQPGQLTGNEVFLLRMGWHARLSQGQTLLRGFFAGATFELGNTWQRREDLNLSSLRAGMSVYLGADTGIGPLYFGLTHAPRGQTGLALFIGRP